jgi:hypothetical protein
MVLVMVAADPEIKVFEYNAGGAFGELALLHGEPRLATVRCTVSPKLQVICRLILCMFTCMDLGSTHIHASLDSMCASALAF